MNYNFAVKVKYYKDASYQTVRARTVKDCNVLE